MPSPRAASTASGSTVDTPAHAFVSIGGMANIASEMIAVFSETPNAGNSASRYSSPSVGTARVALASRVTSGPPRRKWPSAIPSGRLTARGEHHRDGGHLEMRRGEVDDRRRRCPCSSRRRRASEALADEAHDRALCQGVSSRCTSSSSRSATSASTTISTSDDQDLGVDVALEAVVQQGSEAALLDQAADGEQGDRRHGRDAQAREDRRQRERQPHLQHELDRAVAEPARRLDRFLGNAVEADQHVANEQELGIGNERDHHRRGVSDAQIRLQAARTAPATESCR